MAEISTAESEALVGRVYARALQDRAEGRSLGPCEQALYEVEMLVQEVNSGASFEQYFRWASPEEIQRAAARLLEIGQGGAAEIVRRAIAVAFPRGLPASEAEMDDHTAWTPGQEEELACLADGFCEYNGAITNALAAHYRRAAEQVD